MHPRLHASLSIESSPSGTAPRRCPIEHADAALAPDTALWLPMHRRVVAQYATDDDGRRALHLYYGDKEIAFDEPELFGFGEALARQSHFFAGDATTWGAGQSWPTVRDLLQHLLDEGILQRADASSGDRRLADVAGVRPSPLPPATAKTAHDWTACEQRFRELTGTPLEIGHLEMVVPIFRVAHAALDADGRQVGESNVFPPAMRIAVPTNWRTCLYDGTRHQVDRPMNVSALKSMRQHWTPMMRMLAAVRAAYLARFPEAAGGWTVGHVERLATAVLALPTWLLMRVDRPVANGALHPALSSLFRVTDGLRMTMHQMLFVPTGEPTRSPRAAIDSAEILAYAERNYAFHSEHGVCAGPVAMIEEFLAVLVDGRDPVPDGSAPLDDALVDALEHVDAAVDYALLGLRVYAATFSLWPTMADTYQGLARVFARWVEEDPHASVAVRAIDQRLRALDERVKTRTYLAHAAWRFDRQAVYDDMDAFCGKGLGLAPDAPLLSSRLQGVLSPATHGTLRRIVAARLDPHARCATAAIDDVVDLVGSFVARLQRVIAVAGDGQRGINALLGRASPRRPFDAHDIDLHNRLQGARDDRLPYLIDELETLLGLRITLDRHRIAIDEAPRAAPHSKDSDGIRPTDWRAIRTHSQREETS